MTRLEKTEQALSLLREVREGYHMLSSAETKELDDAIRSIEHISQVLTNNLQREEIAKMERWTLASLYRSLA